jgi:hypothetical protein
LRICSRALTPDKQTGGLVDRAGNDWVVFDIDGTREAARKRALSQGEGLPPAFRRLDARLWLLATGVANAGKWSGHEPLCCRRTVESRLGSFGNRGNERYREELRKGLAAIGRYLATHQLPQEHTRLAPRRTIWQWSGALRCGWLRVCHPGQRLSLA